jgi:hypothetical protein
VRYWSTEYDWRKCEASMNALPQFTSEIDGEDLHFIHVRSSHAATLPLIITHGWPGSIIEMLGVVGPLTDPTARGGSGQDAFHLMVASRPGLQARPQVTLPVGFTTFPGEIIRAPAQLVEKSYPTLTYFSEVDKGGQFAWEEPELFATEIRATFRPPRWSQPAPEHGTLPVRRSGESGQRASAATFNRISSINDE